jgi:hypothetical protein
MVIKCTERTFHGEFSKNYLILSIIKKILMVKVLKNIWPVGIQNYLYFELEGVNLHYFGYTEYCIPISIENIGVHQWKR